MLTKMECIARKGAGPLTPTYAGSHFRDCRPEIRGTLDRSNKTVHGELKFGNVAAALRAFSRKAVARLKDAFIVTQLEQRGG